MKNLLLALAVVAMFASGAMAGVFPASQISPLNGSGVTPTGQYGSPSGFADLTINGNDVVTTADPSPADGTTKVFVVGDATSNDFTMSVHIGTTTGCQVGLLARSDTTTMSSYGLAVNFYDADQGAATFSMFKITGGTVDGTNLHSETVPWVTLGGEYDMAFSVKGNYLLGAIADPTHSATFIVNDTSFAGDKMGLLLAASDTTAGQPINGTWENLDVDVGYSAIVLGDTDLDFGVDITDLNNLVANYGATSGKTWAQGDNTGEGAVDGMDLANLLANFEPAIPTSPLASNFLSVPEPSTICLVLSGLAALAFYRLRKR